jgi:DMSO/TMAO reductase YedYZ molybdopterin-dependent catalytic subunit
VSVAEWTGARLSDVLDGARVRKGTTEVLLEGADKGEFKKPDPETPGAIHFSRSLPLLKARQPEVLLAYKMNEKVLPVEHGYPVRAVVPGWYGMASVKWLARIRVLEEPFCGYFETFMYSLWQRSAGGPSLVPVTKIQVKAEIARPMRGEIIPAGKTYRIFGAAWAGESDVTKVDISVDRGATWRGAKLLGESTKFCWRFWEYEWHTPAAGKATLMARASDSQGRTQPLTRDEDLRDGVISHTLPIEVEVRS